ncbi:DNA polymerase III subunit delta' C-terminal domain-containing protein [Francisella orientalis]|uniref:DNA polymerase III subunit delta' n=1 Tax=Francisella orientalis TaxID=299583 RepID=A0AAP6XAE1_9GAMM|nr:DNA polymerase III subunit delta' C-terminal domain-containing protein [Francisella orientalis]AFJ43564.1 DNA polymerase III, delta prime subunit [Francisella orientalis str. Toba 04]AHB98139.1 DNA polymerase III subunit delta' [Francisella orientalis LADL 07-285A]AKN85277.1 DNA polymerase III, delta prime subunit [Francisella orientalis FNO12]AKN86816.1 DNA polymerase III, delta prime subunit [Francisella orientalis FNO24]AKN88355.1 DNA polymerase III, delta prime subunit [Francisella orie
MLSLDIHQQLLDSFFEQKTKNMLHHALIFRVKDVVLLDSFMNSLCQLLLGQNVTDYKDSPYVSVTAIENDEIKVSEIKKIIKNCELTAHNNLAKIVIIEELDLLNESAANALLKTLEEPTADTFFLMFTKNYTDILPTVKSRSIVYDIKFSQKDKYNYLKYTFDMSQEAVEKSLQMARDDINIIAKIKLEQHFWVLRNNLMKVLVNQTNPNVFLKEINLYFRDALYWLTSIIIDVYNYKLNEQVEVANYDKLAVIKYLATKFTDDYIYNLYHKALEAKSYFLNFKKVDKELVLENLILEIIK